MVVHSDATRGFRSGPRFGQGAGVNSALATLLGTEDGVVRRAVALGAVREHVVQHAVRAGHVQSLYSGVLLAPDLAHTRAGRWRAALLRAGPNAALSHITALEVWGLPVPRCREVHVMTGRERRLRVDGIVAHRRCGFLAEPPHVLIRDGVTVTRLEQSLVDSWPMLDGDAQRAPLLQAVGARMTTADRVSDALRTNTPRLPGRAALRALLGKIAAGCRSELELWGYDHVFVRSGIPVLERQVPVKVDGRTVYLDLFHRPTATNFELDGAKWHDRVSQRERDVARDAALAALGIHAIRFTHDRLTLEPEAVRRQVMAILASRSTIVGRKR
jgi:hypothetical protein